MTEITSLDQAERIRQKAHDLFMQYGLRSVSMDDIASALGMSKKTIYQYYADKDELVDAVISAKISRTTECCTLDHQRAENAVHEIFLAMDMMVETFRVMNPGLMFDMQKYHPHAFEKFLSHKNQFLFQVVKSNIERGIREALYRPELPVDLISRYRVESILIPFLPIMNEKSSYSLMDVHQEIALHFVYGLVTPKGYQLIQQYIEQRTKTA
jgi:AcrR family transcriptional regulator